MSASAIPSCTAGVTAEQLSAWRDESLGPAEVHRLQAHAAACPACQERLQEYQSIAAALHAQAVPVPDERLWRGVQARVIARRQRARRFSTPDRMWKGLGAVAAAVLLVAGFAQLLGGYLGSRTTPHPTPTPAPTATPQPHTLAWQPAAQQLSALAPGGLVSLANALTDGNTAYACAGTTSGSTMHFAVWVTHDRAADWSRAADIPFTEPAGSNDQCTLAIDASNASTVAVSMGWHMVRLGLVLSSAVTFVTTDGGASWRRLANSQPSIMQQLASWRGLTYAVRSIGSQPTQVAPGLWMSSDDMRTWQPIDQTIVAAQDQVVAFWINPGSGEILARATSTGSEQEPLWDSTDGGRQWTALTVPNGTGAFEVQAPSAGQSWHICEMYVNNIGAPGDANQLWCSTDGGQHWLSRPTLNFTFTCLKCSGRPGTPTTEAYPLSLVGITSDDAILATAEVPVAGSTPVVPAPSGSLLPVLTLYRLPAGSISWQSLGVLPPSGSDAGSYMQYIPAPGHGVLWALGDYSHLYTVAYP